MAGIYIHIPFCRKACVYCDFHFSVSQDSKEKVIDAILNEMRIRKEYLQGERIDTIYLGGGTPSLLSKEELNLILDAVYKYFPVSPDPEITLEANPDDLTKEKISDLNKTKVNRLSIGVQSFFDEELKWMNRAHNAQQSVDSIKLAQEAGFSNISIDLIYGLPKPFDETWEENLNRAFDMAIQHLSCYCLTIEDRTPLASYIKKGKIKSPDEEKSARQFELLLEQARSRGWKHYEISNFCNDNFFSRHNTSYWRGVKYLGLGPSAHSYNGISRQWNVADNYKYIASMGKNIVPCETEFLTPVQQLNESIMTSLRTMWGLKLTDYPTSIANLLRQKSRSFVTDGFLEEKNDVLTLMDKGKLIADKIILELMIDESTAESRLINEASS